MTNKGYLKPEIQVFGMMLEYGILAESDSVFLGGGGSYDDLINDNGEY